MHITQTGECKQLAMYYVLSYVLVLNMYVLFEQHICYKENKQNYVCIIY